MKEKKLQTLRNNQEYRRVYDRGQKVHTPFFSAFFLKNETDDHRIGITVTRKTGGAVDRNRCKRRLREIIKKHHSAESNLKNYELGFDMVLNVKQSLLTADFAELEEAYARTIERVRSTLGKEPAGEQPGRKQTGSSPAGSSPEAGKKTL